MPSNARPGLIGPIVKLAAASTAGRAIKEAASDATQRAALGLAAGVSGIVGLFCFTSAALTLLERHMDPAEAWAVAGSFYGVVGGFFYLAASRRRS